MGHNNQTIKQNTYSDQLSGAVLSMGAGDYSAFIVPHNKNIIRDGQSIEVLGVHDVADCVGIIGWHEPTKTVYLYHMNEVDERRLSHSANLLTNAIREGSHSNNPLQEVRYTLVTNHPSERNIPSLLDALMSFGIGLDQISIDRQESQLFIDRNSGVVSNSHEKYPNPKLQRQNTNTQDIAGTSPRTPKVTDITGSEPNNKSPERS
ncbi:MAG: hypothetical protein V4612_00510 [Pseudomonadota bacterium]